jgi:hypothetical protein
MQHLAYAAKPVGIVRHTAPNCSISRGAIQAAASLRAAGAGGLKSAMSTCPFCRAVERTTNRAVTLAICGRVHR